MPYRGGLAVALEPDIATDAERSIKDSSVNFRIGLSGLILTHTTGRVARTAIEPARKGAVYRIQETALAATVRAGNYRQPVRELELSRCNVAKVLHFDSFYFQHDKTPEIRVSSVHNFRTPARFRA